MHMYAHVHIRHVRPAARPHQRVVVAEQRQSVRAVLLLRRGTAALVFVDGVSLGLRQAQEPADHAEVLPQGPVLWAGVLLPAQQLTQPALQEEHRRGDDRL